MSLRQSDGLLLNSNRGYEYLLKLIIVGDPDVGKEEILQEFETDSEREFQVARASASLPRPSLSVAANGNQLANLSVRDASGNGVSLNESAVDEQGGTAAMDPRNATSLERARSRCDDGVCRTVTMLLDGKRIKIAMWTASGQGRFAFVLRSLARGAHGIVLVYDITSRYSFKGLERWLKEVDTHAHGTPKVLVGNRLHLAFRRQVSDAEATAFARRYALEHFEISPLAHNFNVLEAFASVCRAALKRTELPATLRVRRADPEPLPQPPVPSLQELCVKSLCASLTVYDIARLPLPERVRQLLKSYAVANPSYIHLRNTLSTLKKRHKSLLGAFKLNSPFSAPKGPRSAPVKPSCTCTAVRRSRSASREPAVQSSDENVRTTLCRTQSLLAPSSTQPASAARPSSAAKSSVSRNHKHSRSHNNDKCCLS